MFQQILDTTRPSAVQKRTLWNDVKKASWSSHAISRTVHSNSNRHWSDSEDLALCTRFAAIVTEKAGQGRTYKQASKAQRKSIILALSLEFHRSPMAIIIRAKGLKLIVALSPTPVTPVVPTLDPSADALATVAPVDATTAAILAIIAQNAANAAMPQTVSGGQAVPPSAQVVAQSTAKTTEPHVFGNSQLRSMYQA